MKKENKKDLKKHLFIDKKNNIRGTSHRLFLLYHVLIHHIFQLTINNRYQIFYTKRRIAPMRFTLLYTLLKPSF